MYFNFADIFSVNLDEHVLPPFPHHVDKKGNSTGIQFQKLVLHDISKPVNSEKFSDLFNLIRGP